MISGGLIQLCLKEYICINVTPEADLRIRALSAHTVWVLQWHIFSIFVDPKQISVVSKSEKKKKILCSTRPPVIMPLEPFDATYFLMQIICLRLFGPNLFGGAPQMTF